MSDSAPGGGLSGRGRMGRETPMNRTRWIGWMGWVLLLAAGAVRAEEPLRATLENGLRVVIVRHTLAPVATTEISYLAGANESPEAFPGMAHALEHMMFRGSPSLSGEQLSTVTAALGGDFNAVTQQTATQYYLTVPADQVDVALRIEAARLGGLLATPELWARERGAIEQEVAMDLSSPMYQFYRRLLAAMYAGTPYARDGLGTRESFQATTAEMLKAFHAAWYAPNNAILVVVGEVDPQRTLERVREIFEPIPARAIPPRAEVSLPPLQPATIRIDTDLPYGMAVVAYRLPGYRSPDFAAGQVLADALDSKRGKLYGLVVEGKALTAEFGGSALPQAAMGYAMAAFAEEGRGEALLAELREIVADYVRNGVPEELVEAAKRREVTQAEGERNSIPGLAQLWSQALAVEGRASPDEDLAAIRRVTVEDVNRVARQCLANETAVTARLTPKPSGKPVASQGFTGKESFAPQQAKRVEVPDWAKRAVALPEALPPATQPVDTRLPNGLRLIVQPVLISRIVSVQGRVRTNADLQAPEGKEGVDEVLDNLFSYGTASLDRVAFQSALDELGADETAGTAFSLQVLDGQFERGLELLADNLLHPALPPEAFEIVREESAGALVGEMQSPGYLSKRALRAALYPPEDPALRRPTPESIRGLSLDDVRAYYRSVFRPDMTTLVVIGPVTPDSVRAAVERQFGAWQATGPKPPVDPPPVPANKPSATAVPSAARVQVDVTLAETLALTRHDPEYYHLQLGMHVLSGAFYATRLYRDLREEAGLVYAVEAELQARKTRSLLAVTYACDPPNVSTARGLVERDLRQLQTDPISPEELLQAKTLLVRQIPLAQASVEGLARQWLHLVEEELPLDEAERAAQRYRSATAEQVREAFRRYLRPDGFVQVTVGPTPQ